MVLPIETLIEFVVSSTQWFSASDL